MIYAARCAASDVLWAASSVLSTASAMYQVAAQGVDPRRDDDVVPCPACAADMVEVPVGALASAMLCPACGVGCAN